MHGAHGVGRIALERPSGPVIHPMSHPVTDGGIVFMTTAGSRRAQAAENR
ncbi:pyridoxamine 5'-phosphate oxidase family protein [Streptomyces sp. NPDC050145]